VYLLRSVVLSYRGVFNSKLIFLTTPPKMISLWLLTLENLKNLKHPIFYLFNFNGFQASNLNSLQLLTNPIISYVARIWNLTI